MEHLSFLNIPITINSIIISMEIGAYIWNLKSMGITCMKFYTILSNLFACFTSAFMTYFLIMKAKTGKAIPNILIIFKLCSTCCLTLTLLVVLFILSWSGNGLGPVWLIFGDANLVQHLLAPIYSIISLVLWEVDFEMTYNYIMFPLIPTIAYGTVLIPLNIAEIVDGPYPFLRVRNQSVGISILWCIIIFGINLLISYLLVYLANFFKKKYPNIMRWNEESSKISTIVNQDETKC